MKSYQETRLKTVVSDGSPPYRTDVKTRKLVLGEVIMGEQQQPEKASEQQLINRLSQENQQLKQALKAKNQEIEQLTQHRHLKSEFETILQGVADALVIVDDLGNVQFVNPAAEALFARSAQELLNHCLGLPVSGQETVINIVRPDGQLIIAEMRVAEILWNDKTAHLASLRNITERQQAQATIKESERAVSSNG